VKRFAPAVQATLVTMHHDRVAAEVSAALAARAVEAVLLRGPAAARRLYADGAARQYTDCDLLVRLRDLEAAERVLAELGFARILDEDTGAKPAERHAHEWIRHGDRSSVDLHWTIVGARDPDALWEALRAHSREEPVAGRAIAVPDDAALALIVALHLAAHARDDGPKPLEDARRAVEGLGVGAWRDAAVIAASVGAEGRFGAAVRLAGGDGLAERLGLADDRTWRALVVDPDGASRAVSLEEIARARGWRGKAALLRRAILPPRATLAYKRPDVYAYGPARLAAAHARRLAGLALSAPSVVRAWRRGRRRARTG
jgi:hypothetical protein